ncbi:response regulator [Pontibacter akesuensis]|uniref:CheY chemotaxis protein or a CheY-like REC (Receiver) domain n=1 Tax=Pontibacter akesuensis TaxID=388950 RepID=A0A1I7GGV8_9BACT|nr:response regulator [Pontibacter akesuensis]GHA56899.1 hypothetical protein GCM10007389_05660 [Pontibacter akesuensis]SFU47710.1 CheY chemotaxis protein or a CheY-like REC (receiver) domain [Pontibacter akesuensis]
MELTKQVLEANPNPIYIKNRQGKIVIANAAFAKMHKVPLPTLLAEGKLPNDYAFERDLEVMESNSPASFEESYRTDSESKTWYHTIKNAIVLENGERYLISVSFDISSCKNALQAAASQPEAQETYLNEVRQELSASAQAILSMANHLRKQGLSKDQEAHLNALLSIAGKLPDIPQNALLKAKAPDEQRVQQQPLPEEQNGHGNLKGVRVLLAEDEPTDLLLASRLLRSWGVLLDVASSSELILKQAREKPYDLILMDVGLKDEEGYTSSYHIKHLPYPNQSTPIVAFTAQNVHIDSKRYRQAGFQDLLFKPYGEKDLYQVICRNTGRSGSSENGAARPAQQALYDFSGLGSLMDDPMFVRKMQLLFVNSVPQQLTSLADAIYSENWGSVGHITHRLRSIFSNIRVHKATDVLKEIEQNAASALNIAANHTLLSTLYSITNAIVADFEEQLQANPCATT